MSKKDYFVDYLSFTRVILSDLTFNPFFSIFRITLILSGLLFGNYLLKGIQGIFPTLFNYAFFVALYIIIKSKTQHSAKLKFRFLSTFLLLAYFHYHFGMEWVITPFSNLINGESLVISLGSLIEFPFIEFINEVLKFIFLLLDWFIVYKTVQLTEYLLFKNKGFSILRFNISFLKSALKRPTLKSILIIIIILTTTSVYYETFDNINEVNDTLALIVHGVALISQSLHGTTINELLKDPEKLLGIKNNFFKAGKLFHRAEKKLAETNLPRSELSPTLNFLDNISYFSKITVPYSIALFEDYAGLMNSVAKELLRRAYWWELEKQNITYDPRKDFYSKFETKINTRMKQGSDLLTLQVEKISIALKNTFFADNDNIHQFMKTIDDLSRTFEQLQFLTSLGPPLLNATFASIEITNALAFDQFITARKLNNRAEEYFTEANRMLGNYTFDSSLNSVTTGLFRVLAQLNSINNEFVRMTRATKSMFLNISSAITQLNSTTFTFAIKNFSSNSINNSINDVAKIVERNLVQIQNYTQYEFSGLILPFKPIFAHFLWFYNGYKGAVDGYRYLWQAAEHTIDLFNTTNYLFFEFNNTMQSISSSSNQTEIDINQFSVLISEFELLKSKILESSNELDFSVIDGALVMNETMWVNILGYNNSKRLENKTRSFYEFYNQFSDFMQNSFSNGLFLNKEAFLDYYDINVGPNITFVPSLSVENIFISFSEELEN